MYDEDIKAEYPAFGVGRVLSVRSDGTLNCAWMGNMADKLLGRYLPCWADAEVFEYGIDPSRPGMQPYDTDATNTWVHKDDLADVGFELTPGYNVPRLTLERAQAHPSFGGWRLEG